MKVIPVRGDLPHYEFTITLDGVVFLFEFKWNDRSSEWSFDLSKEDGTLVIAGAVVKVNWGPLDRFQGPDLPAGNLFAWDSSGQSEEIQEIGDLGTRVLMLYQEADT